MIDLSDGYMLMIEPDHEGEPSTEPLEDEITSKVDYLYSLSRPSPWAYNGIHMTKCGKYSDDRLWFLPNGVVTNSLCTYYIRYYRSFIPNKEINKINNYYNEIMNNNYDIHCVDKIYEDFYNYK